MRNLFWVLLARLIVGLLSWDSAVVTADSQITIRAGHFPNITHAQGVIGQANGWFEKALGKLNGRYSMQVHRQLRRYLRGSSILHI